MLSLPKCSRKTATNINNHLIKEVWPSGDIPPVAHTCCFNKKYLCAIVSVQGHLTCPKWVIMYLKFETAACVMSSTSHHHNTMLAKAIFFYILVNPPQLINEPPPPHRFTIVTCNVLFLFLISCSNAHHNHLFFVEFLLLTTSAHSLVLASLEAPQPSFQVAFQSCLIIVGWAAWSEDMQQWKVCAKGPPQSQNHPLFNYNSIHYYSN